MKHIKRSALALNFSPQELSSLFNRQDTLYQVNRAGCVIATSGIFYSFLVPS
jgi:hypothetical protein